MFSVCAAQVTPLKDRISGHHAADLGLERPLKRDQMFGEIIARENRVPAIGIVAIIASLCCTVADPVFGNRNHAVAVDAALAVLETGDIGLRHSLTICASSPNVPLIRGQRGSLARSIWGDSAS